MNSMTLQKRICLVSASFYLGALWLVPGATNEWAKPTSGHWEEPFWSLGVLPDATQSVVFNNAGWKALAIGTNAAQNFPESLRVQSLHVGAPPESFNTLLLNFVGFQQPLQTDSLIVESNSAIVMHGSALEVISTTTDGSTGNLLLGGRMDHGDFSQVTVQGALNIGGPGQGAYYLTNGNLTAGGEFVGGPNPGRFVQYGGSNQAGDIRVLLEGEFHLHGGEVTATNGITVGVGDFANLASFHQVDGHVNADIIVNGRYLLNGGTIRGRMSVPGNTLQRVDGLVLQNGGTNFALSMDLGFPNRFGGGAICVLSNGVLRVDSSTSFRGGSFSQYDGLHTIASNLVMQGTHVGPGTINANYFLGGGVLSVGSVAVNRDSALTVSNGTLNAGALSMNLEATGNVSVVSLHDGAITVSNVIDIGLGNIMMSGGNFQSPGITVFRGEVRQSGGTNEAGVVRMPQNRIQIGQGHYYLSGGTLLSSNLSLGAGAPGGFAGLNGVFEQTGGDHHNSGGMVMWGTVRSAGVRPNGEYRLSAGLLVTPSLQLAEGGAFTQSGGSNLAGILALQDGATYVLSAGSISSSNTSIRSGFGRYYYFGDHRSFYTQTGGSHAANQFGSGPGGLARLQGGSLTAPSISVGPEAELYLTGAAVTNSGTFTLLSGAWVSANGNYPQLGKLTVTSSPPSPDGPPYSRLDFGTGAATLRFQDSRDASWDSQLVITNWSGLVSGGGTDRLYVGTSAQGLSQAELGLIRFANPAGMSAGNYPARILDTGEIVPILLPSLGFTSDTEALILSWTGDYQLLSATNVAGPYDPIPGATPPFTNAFSDPQRFYQLRSPAP